MVGVGVGVGSMERIHGLVGLGYVFENLEKKSIDVEFSILHMGQMLQNGSGSIYLPNDSS